MSTEDRQGLKGTVRTHQLRRAVGVWDGLSVGIRSKRILDLYGNVITKPVIVYHEYMLML